MNNRVTIQDIADELGLSRNTVSKALNSTGVLADSTRDRILQKAKEMKYKQFSYAALAETTAEPENFAAPAGQREIALFTNSFLGASHFSSTMLDKFQHEIAPFGYSMTMHRVAEHEINYKLLPASFHKESTAAIICFEMFDYSYDEMLCALDIPVLFVDTPALGLEEPLKADCLYMSNQPAIQSIVREMAHRGKKRMGFVGNFLHCQSFYERYTAFVDAVRIMNLPDCTPYTIPYNKSPLYPDPDVPQTCAFFTEKFKAMPQLPEVILCANDFIAIDVLRTLRDMNLRVPEDILLCGFDDSSESSILTPTLTTVHIHSQIMGFMAANLLISRIREPSLNFRTVYTETTPVYRQSTGDQLYRKGRTRHA